MTNSEDPDQTAPQGAVWSGSSQFCQSYLSYYSDNICLKNIMQNILREKYFDMVSKG